MPEDVKVAESSPAPVEATPEALPIEQWNEGQREAWLKTGEAPVAEPAKQEAAAEEAGSESDPAPDAQEEQKQQEKAPKRGAEYRKSQLGNEIQELLRERRSLREEVESLKRAKQEPEPPAVKTEDKPQDGAPKKPKAEDYQTWDEYETARDEYVEKLAEYKAEQALAKKTEEAERTSRQKELATAWSKREAAAKEIHQDFDDVVKGARIHLTDDMRDFIVDSEIGPELFYHLAVNPDIPERIAKLSKTSQARELTRMEDSITANRKKADPAPKPKLTAAKQPPTEVAGRSVQPDDEADAAVISGDFRRYSRVMNQRETRRG